MTDQPNQPDQQPQVVASITDRVNHLSAVPDEAVDLLAARLCLYTDGELLACSGCRSEARALVAKIAVLLRLHDERTGQK